MNGSGVHAAAPSRGFARGSNVRRKPSGFGHFGDGCEFWISLAAQRLVERGARNASLGRDFGHAARASDGAERPRNLRGTSVLAGETQIVSHRGFVVEKLGGVVRQRLQASSSSSVEFAASSIASAMSFDYVLLSPPHKSTVSSAPRR